MLSLTMLFGYPVDISDLQTNDMLYFTGTKWINLSPEDVIPVEDLANPSTTHNADKSVFTLDGIPVRKTIYKTKTGGLVMSLQVASTELDMGLSERELIFTPQWYRRKVKTNFRPDITFETVAEMPSSPIAIPTLYYYIT